MKILIVDDHPLVRKGLISVLSIDNEYTDIFEASNIKESIKLLQLEKPDIAIIDLRLGKEDGLDLVKMGKELVNTTKYVILTSSMREEDFIRAKNIGIDGYIIKEAITEDLMYAIHVVARGKKYYDPIIMEYSYSRENNALGLLTERETDVLKELSKGLSNNQIAKKLFISENTVKKHISNILDKLDLNHRTEAALLASKII